MHSLEVWVVMDHMLTYGFGENTNFPYLDKWEKER
jgi:hypothetical protein